MPMLLAPEQAMGHAQYLLLKTLRKNGKAILQVELSDSPNAKELTVCYFPRKKNEGKVQKRPTINYQYIGILWCVCVCVF